MISYKWLLINLCVLIVSARSTSRSSHGDPPKRRSDIYEIGGNLWDLSHIKDYLKDGTLTLDQVIAGVKPNEGATEQVMSPYGSALFGGEIPQKSESAPQTWAVWDPWHTLTSGAGGNEVNNLKMGSLDDSNKLNNFWSAPKDGSDLYKALFGGQIPSGMDDGSGSGGGDSYNIFGWSFPNSFESKPQTSPTEENKFFDFVPWGQLFEDNDNKFGGKSSGKSNNEESNALNNNWIFFEDDLPLFGPFVTESSKGDDSQAFPFFGGSSKSDKSPKFPFSEEIIIDPDFSELLPSADAETVQFFDESGFFEIPLSKMNKNEGTKKKDGNKKPKVKYFWGNFPAVPLPVIGFEMPFLVGPEQIFGGDSLAWPAFRNKMRFKKVSPVGGSTRSGAHSVFVPPIIIGGKKK